MRIIGAAALAMLLLATQARADELTGTSTGGDWARSSELARAMWVFDAGKAIGRNPIHLGQCLNAALTVEKKSEAQAVAMLRKNDLAMLTAMCASAAARWQPR